MAMHYNKTNIMTLVETTRQRLGFKKGDMFEPTPNVRNPHMLEEAEAFNPLLRSFERAVRDYHRHVQGFLGSLIPMLEENLPRVWTAVSGGLAEPVRPQISHGHPSRIGGDFSAPLILERLEVLNRGMEEDILAPLRRWHEGLAIAKERMKGLESLRRDVDKERRKAEKKFKKQEARLRRAYMGAGYGGSSSSSDSDFEDNDYVVPRGRLLEDYQRLALHTERHLNALMDSYRDQERLLWEQLSGLVTDAAWLESYAAAAMLKVKETMQAVALALGPCKQPLPAFRHAVYPFDGQYGQIGHNIELIKAMGPRAHELASGAKPAGTDYLPYTPLRAKRGVSTPLMVGAAAGSGRQQLSLAMEPVPPVQVGAGAIPLEAVPAGMRDSIIQRVEERARGSGTRVADMPALPSPLTPEPTSARLMSSTPSGAPVGSTPAASGGYRSSSTAAITGGPIGSGAHSAGVGGSGLVGGRGVSSSTAVPSTTTRIVGGSSTGGTTRIPESTTTTVAGGNKGIIAKATETVGAAIGSVTGAARSAAESFREGVLEGETATAVDRDTSYRTIDTADRMHATAAPTLSSSRGVGFDMADAHPGATASDTVLPASGGGLQSTSMGFRTSEADVGKGIGSPMLSSGYGINGASAVGPMSAAGDTVDRAVSPNRGLSDRGAVDGMGTVTGSPRPAIGGTTGAGPMSAAAATGDSPRAGFPVSASAGSPRMSETGGAGMSDVTGETRAIDQTGAVEQPWAVNQADDDGFDSFVSAVRAGPMASGTTDITAAPGLKHQQRAMAAAPAGFDEYSREGRAPAAEQQQGGGGLMAAVKRAVGQ